VRVSINGDRPLPLSRKIQYFGLNAIRNLRPYRDLDASLDIVDFRCRPELLAELPGTPSPSRALSDLFWRQLPWADLERELGPLNLFDIGCGSGGAGIRLRQWSGLRVARYVGLDVQPHAGWPALQEKEAGFRFVAGSAEELLHTIPGDTNLVVSQSALEHVPDDLTCFAALRAFASSAARPILQIHLVPSQACLRLYRLHGFRQYTPRTLTPVARMFSGFSTCRLFRLGGAACTALHLRWITRQDRRAAHPDGYRRALADAVARDMMEPQRSPAFYALVIHSNPAHRLIL
jgi:SAM-dependent methyltransferase